MIINYQRREELKQFAEDFYQKIKEVENNMKNGRSPNKIVPDLLEDNEMTSSNGNSRHSKVYRIESKLSPLWKPNKFKGDYFNRFVGMTPGKEITCWDRERINLAERSYEKENNKIHWTPPGNKKILPSSHDENSLSQLGKNIIGKFIIENERLESKRKQEEEYYENLKHSKHPVLINPWKYTSKNDLFSDYKILKRTESFTRNNIILPKLSSDIKFN